MTIKILLAAVIALGTTIAQAANVEHEKTTCQTRMADEAFGETVVMVIEDGKYHVSHYGHSRNKYEATYVETSSSPSRVGYISFLTKISDESTWKDMPNKLWLNHVTFGNVGNTIMFLDLLDSMSVSFKASDCETTSVPVLSSPNDVASCPAGSKPGHCPSRLCGSCI